MGDIIQSDRCGTCQNNTTGAGGCEPATAHASAFWFAAAAVVVVHDRMMFVFVVMSLLLVCVRLIAQKRGSRSNLHN